MSYQAPYIDSAGMHVPEYADIRQALIDGFKQIFGADIYLGEDSMDYQMIALFADMMDDIGSLAINAYNSRNPDFASGAALDLLLPLNGISRLAATYSTVTLTISGAESTVIPAGSKAMDANGKLWVLLQAVQIAAGGSVTAAARCADRGAVYALSGSITQIYTPLAGWQSVTNAADAIPGRNEESDAEVRERRALSVTNNAAAIMEAMVGSLAAISGVLKLRVYENDAATEDANGIPAHSICAVVSGGEDADIAEVLFKKKAPGCGTFGTTSESVEDVYGNANTINFMRPTSVHVKVAITVKSLSGYGDAVAALIKEAVIAHVIAQDIGQTVSAGLMWGEVLSANAGRVSPAFVPTAIQVGATSESLGAEMVLGFDELAVCESADITITVV